VYQSSAAQSGPSYDNSSDNYSSPGNYSSSDNYSKTSYYAPDMSYHTTPNDYGSTPASDAGEYQTSAPAQNSASVIDAKAPTVRPPSPAPAPISPIPVVSRPVDASPPVAPSGTFSHVPAVFASQNPRPDRPEEKAAEPGEALLALEAALLALEKGPVGKQELIGASSSAAIPEPPAARASDLLTGSLPLDLANLGGAVEKFFDSLDDLAGRVTLSTESIGLAQWLLTGATATGILEFVRRKTLPPPSRPDDADDAVWAPYPVLAVLPPEE
jgi:hypothetical protein